MGCELIAALDLFDIVLVFTDSQIRSALVTALSSTAKSLDTIENGVSSLQITLRETADQVIRKEKGLFKCILPWV